MTLRTHAANVGELVRAGGVVTGLREWASRVYWRKVRPSPSGANVYEFDWDALVVLDACRADLFDAVAPEYPFLSPGGSITSVGSHSVEWMDNTFTPEYADETARTAYVCSNVCSAERLDAGQFGVLDEVWRYGMDETLNTPSPAVVTDRAVAVGREGGFDRLIVHYMQPHTPFTRRDGGLVFETAQNHKDTHWNALRRGEIGHGEFWDAYADTLRFVLDSVATLLSNLDAETVVLTADHGNALGESGLYWHPQRVSHPVLRRVPWCETTARDTGEYEPPEYDREPVNTATEQLEALGYR